jgi:putative aldouronate transport system substrate-binding protein
MNTRKLIVLILAVVFSFTLILTGCGGNAANADKTSTAANDASKLPPVELKWYTIGDGQPVDTALVMNEVNKKLKDKINATLSLNVIDWNNYSQKINIMSAAGEAFDLCFSSGWTDFYSMAAKGYFADLTDLIPKYGAKSKEVISQSLFDAFKVKGKLLAVPNLQGITYKDEFFFNVSIAKKYKIPSKVNGIDALDPYFNAIKKGEPSLKYIFYTSRTNDMTGTYFWRGGKNINSPMFDVAGAGVEKVVQPDGSIKIMSGSDTKQNKDAMAWHRKAYLNGWIPKDVLTIQYNKDVFKNGQAACVYGSVNPDQAKLEADWGKVYTVDIGDTNWLTADMVSGSATSISFNSKNKERAMMLIELADTDPEIFNNLILGVEGKHWVRKDKNQWDYAPGVNDTNSGYKMTSMGWAIGNDFIKFTKVGTDPNTPKKIQAFDKSAKAEPAIGFVPDLTPYKTQIANMGNVYNEIGISLYLGVVDPAKYFDECNKKYVKAGINDVVAGVQKQFNDYLAANK